MSEAKKAQPATSRRIARPELLAANKIDAILDGLGNQEAVRRVLWLMCDIYDVPPAKPEVIVGDVP